MIKRQVQLHLVSRRRGALSSVERARGGIR